MEGGGGVLFVIEPGVERSELGDAVFDVVERYLEEMELALPHGALGIGVFGPVDDRGGESGECGEPGVGAIFEGMTGVGVKPVLVLIDDGDPCECAEDAFELVSFGAGGVLGVIVEDVVVVGGEEFHGHGCDFAELEGGVADEDDGDVA